MTTPTGPRIGSLFSGTGALDMAVQDVFGGTVAWHSQFEPPDKNGREDTDQYAAKILARHMPDVPNLGDINAINWHAVLDEHGPVDIVTGGFPCTDVSSAGQRAGLINGTRSGLWIRMAHAISILQPRIVVIENVEGLLSAKAAGDLEPCPHCMGDGTAEPALRALGAVLGDLASLGFDAEWARVAASEVGAAHPRKRVFVLAWPAAAVTADLGHERGGTARDGWAGSADGDLTPADAQGDPGWLEHGDGCAAPDADILVPGYDGELPAGRDALWGRLRDDAAGCGPAPTHTAGVGYGDAGTPILGGIPATTVAGDHSTPADADGSGQRSAVLELRPGQPDLDWGAYGPAIRRHERIFGRPAPWPTDLRGRLSPVFTEWLMGFPDGWVTCTAGLNRNAMLKALGVVPAQAAAALRLLLARTPTTPGAQHAH